MLTPRSIEVTWTLSSSSDITGYLISYATTASYIDMSNRSRSIDNTTRATLINLEENTLYTITVQATSNNRMSANSDSVSVTTYTDGE